MPHPLPVLIAGAGPVGLTAALILARAEVPVRVFEKATELAEDLRASTWHPPTLDMVEDIDPELARTIVSEGLISRYTQYRDRRDGLIAEFDLDLLRGDTRHPYRVQYEQFKYTRLVMKALQGCANAEVLTGCAVTGVVQGADSVSLHYEDAQGPKTAAGAFLIGADGTWSAVRQAVGIEFEGFTFPERFYAVSTDFDFAQHFDRLAYVNYVSDPEEWCVLLRVPGLWRVLFPTRLEEPDETVVSDAATEARLQGVLVRPQPYRTVHRTIYRVHQRVAKRYCLGRVALAGDAAHVNNPLGGMGMNGGLHDGIRLAHQLIRAVRGEPAAALLEQYERERRPIAIEYINANTARNKKVMEERDPAARRRSQDEMRRTVEDPAAAREFLLRSSMISALRAAARVSQAEGA